MMKKRISSKKTGSGYSINVYVKDGCHVKPIVKVLERYFAWVEETNDPFRQEKIVKEVDDEAQKLQACSQG